MAELLHSLSQDLFLSPACRAGVHDECHSVDVYSGLTCCCPLCVHTDLDGAPPPVLLPLLHFAEEGRQQAGYVYAGQALGVRDDVYRAIETALQLHIHELRRPRVAYDAAVRAALALLPRIGA